MPADRAVTVAPPVEVKTESVPEGKVVDFLTGKHVKDTPEEYVRQNIEKAIVRQYGYAREDCQPEFRIRFGSSNPRVDIVIWPPETDHKQETACLLIECKKPGTSPKAKKDGIEQLKSYMAACANARYGLWTNGDDRFCFAKRTTGGGKIVFEEIIEIPAAGQTEADAQRPKRKDLKAATAANLLYAFRRCHNYIAGTEGMQKPQAFWELLKLIFCKIEDERSRELSFFVTPTELGSSTAAAPAKARLQSILTEKVVKKYPTIFSTPETRTIELRSNTLAYVVSQLQSFSLLASPVDVKGVAYEEIVGSNLRGDRGEFRDLEIALVGVVTNVRPHSSVIRFITDGTTGVGAIVPDAGEHTGLVTSPNPGQLRLTGVPRQAAVEEGQVVLTAGEASGDLPSLYPRGMVIGVISSVGSRDVDAEKSVQVEPLVDPRAEHYLVVLRPISEEAKRRARGE